jgi:hypothetical protein
MEYLDKIINKEETNESKMLISLCPVKHQA